MCARPDHEHAQVNGAKATGAVVSSAAAGAAAGIGIVSGAGAAAGLSGPGIMSGLAAVGGSVGAGAVGGLVVLGAAPAASAVAVMNITLRDNPTLSEGDRVARRAGHASSAAGALGGTAVGIGTVSAAGLTAGLSGAGITSGLAAIGATVGGGMAAGSATFIAGPAVAAAGLGYGVYRAVRRLSSDDSIGQRLAAATNQPSEDRTDDDLSIAAIDTIEFRDVAADSGKIVRVSEGRSDLR